MDLSSDFWQAVKLLGGRRNWNWEVVILSLWFSQNLTVFNWKHEENVSDLKGIPVKSQGPVRHNEVVGVFGEVSWTLYNLNPPEVCVSTATVPYGRLWRWARPFVQTPCQCLIWWGWFEGQGRPHLFAPRVSCMWVCIGHGSSLWLVRGSPYTPPVRVPERCAFGMGISRPSQPLE